MSLLFNVFIVIGIQHNVPLLFEFV